MPNLTIEDVPDDIRREFQQLPAEERRMLEAQVILSIADGLQKRQAQNGPSKLERVRAFLKKHEGEFLDPAIVEEALNMRHP